MDVVEGIHFASNPKWINTWDSSTYNLFLFFSLAEETYWIRGPTSSNAQEQVQLPQRNPLATLRRLRTFTDRY